ncbi:magnesium transporter [Fusibacter bizertensis]|uniref:Magnesium transporter MgtE n=1 Tax=Fusibacter bizertensis TaxID=1488331 RepID=A0ABT6NDB8_9FIRM|nr:magnesium transporter [Fusibacter bizertensis]MDH8678413.1 magnesium transporter [Fusibacter bizertensis]
MGLLMFYEYLSKVETLLEENKDLELHVYLEDMHAADIAEVLENLEDDQQIQVFGLLSDEKATEVLEEINSEQFSILLKDLTYEKKVTLLENMSQDDIVDKLSELPESRQQEIIAFLDYEDAADVKELLVYEEGTAGRSMTKDYVSIRKDYSVYYAIETLRAIAPDAETIYYLYVTDEIDRLVGVISLRELIISPPNRTVDTIMNENLITVNVNDDQEDVAKVVSKYDLLAVPVVDNDNILRGIITIDDVLDILEEEATEDIFKFAGTSEYEIYENDTTLFKRVRNSVMSRLPWLIITIFGGLLSARILANFQGTISANATLAMFMPLLTGMGGNVGTQSSTITVRNIATHVIEGTGIFRTLIHEISVGLFVGIVCSTMVAFAAMMMQADYHIALIVGIAMWANMTTAATIGTIVPLVFKKIGVDPAVASAPFITTTIDLTGLTIYFSLATIMITKV